ncbi:MAG: CsbD family protein [Desulfobacterales bacterium]
MTVFFNLGIWVCIRIYSDNPIPSNPVKFYSLKERWSLTAGTIPVGEGRAEERKRSASAKSAYDGGKKMNWDQIEGNWKQAKGKLKEKWGKLTDDDLDVVAGKKEQLVGKLQDRYGWGREKAQKEADAYIKGL